MKILEQPTKPPAKPAHGWWIGRRHRCQMCKTLVELEAGDGNDFQEGDIFITFFCPVCTMPCCESASHEVKSDPAHKVKQHLADIEVAKNNANQS